MQHQIMWPLLLYNKKHGVFTDMFTGAKVLMSSVISHLLQAVARRLMKSRLESLHQTASVLLKCP